VDAAVRGSAAVEGFWGFGRCCARGELDAEGATAGAVGEMEEERRWVVAD
jgi:hypothetical protein